MYVCKVITYSKSEDQPGKVANLARGQLNREDENFINISLSQSAPENWSHETVSAVSSRASLLISIPRLNRCLLTRFLPISEAASIYLF